MSSLLYSLGRWSFVHRRRVVAFWIVLLIASGALMGAFSEGTRNSFDIPGTESQASLDTLERTFPQLSGASAQLVMVAPKGTTFSDPEVKADVARTLKTIDKLDFIESTLSPYSSLISRSISNDDRAAIAQVQLTDGFGDVTPDMLTDLEATATPLRDAGFSAEFGGVAFTNTGPKLTPTEAVGVAITFVVLLLFLGSVSGALIPLVTALVGVGVTMSITFAATSVLTLSSATPLLALMIGLAVGIDYALFIISRYREELSEGVSAEESTARAIATAGSAVIFAGATVMIALVGLSVANIPFLTAMGVVAGGAVFVAVLVALTLLPAFIGFAGNRLTPTARAEERAARARFAHRWVSAVTRRPVATITLVVVVLGLMALPARGLLLALDDNGTAPTSTTQRKAFDLVTERFGPGFNAPLLVEANIVDSTDPLGLVAGLKADIEQMDGVEAVILATPNPNADTAVIEIVPTTGGSDVKTQDLVERIRAASPAIEKKHGVRTTVTGATAIQIDISSRLKSALLPFGILVVGLSLLLLAAVFRSILVPLKATLGYLLSLGASFGAVALVFNQGWLSGPLNVEHTGPVISFLPIVLMGVLFGLAMDYEVFLVSRMKEEFARTQDASGSIVRGFVSSGRVVTAAAAIMFAVFAAFVPDGDPSIKPVALGLAVGVFVDAFLVRMIVVPAALQLFGARAWWLPTWIDRWLPHVDVEGEGLRARLTQASWPADRDDVVLTAEHLVLAAPYDVDRAPLDLRLERGRWMLVTGHDRGVKNALLLTLAGRLPFADGQMRVADHLLPYEAGHVRARVQLAEFTGINDLDPQMTVGEHVAQQLSVGTLRAWIAKSRIDEVITGINSALFDAYAWARAGDPLPLRRNDRVAYLSDLERLTLGVALTLTSSPDIVIIPDVDDLRSPSQIQLFWSTVGALTGIEGPSVIASVTYAAEGPHDVEHVDVVELPARLPHHEMAH
ncbi:MMPL family transporter [Aeromicrobium sp.]|uniref:MMPL family transporter n=1 Tax=Aeromicrobium sp. TaxID=1871063 RepID=UPI002FC5CDE9